MREKNLCKSRWSTYNKCTMGYKISRKVQFSVLKLTSDFFFPQHFLPTVHYTYCHCCVHCYSLYGKIRNVWTESKKTCLRFFFKFGPRWPKRTHYKLFMSTDDKYTSISKDVLIENYLLIEYFCEFFFLILVKTFK